MPRRAAMQLNLNFLDQLAAPPSPSPQVPTAWEQIDAAARIAAVAMLVASLDDAAGIASAGRAANMSQPTHHGLTLVNDNNKITATFVTAGHQNIVEIGVPSRPLTRIGICASARSPTTSAWKPKSLKAECLPGDNCDIDALLEELILNNQVIRYSMEGKEYGLIKDFTQWQRPKRPVYVHPLPAELTPNPEHGGLKHPQSPNTFRLKHPQSPKKLRRGRR
jgi:hypothetical protein